MKFKHYKRTLKRRRGRRNVGQIGHVAATHHYNNDDNYGAHDGMYHPIGGKSVKKTRGLTRDSRDSDSSDSDSDNDNDSSSNSDSDSGDESMGNESVTKTNSSLVPSSNKSLTSINKLCDDKMTLQDCELVILRSAVDVAEAAQGKKSANSEEVVKIIKIVENFLKKKGLICYGGTAINNILPKKDQFYNKEIEIPDYDFFSANALNDAKELTDIYVAEGFEEAEAKSGQHHGTFKVFVNFIPVADITSVPAPLFTKLKKEARRVGGILYAPPNYLRMSMYLELSRPAGDVSRWEKVLKRLSALNKRYPLVANNCDIIEFQRKMDANENNDKIYDTVKQTLIDQNVVFFGGYAVSLISKYMPRKLQQKLSKNPDFDVLSEEPEMTAEIVKERLEEIGIKNVKIAKIPGIGEIVSTHYEIKVGEDNVAVVYEPLACHSYNTITQHGNDVNIATIDTMLSFYLAFLYIDEPLYNYNPERILCMSHFLFEVQQKNRLKQKGLLKRFTLNCIGHQETIEEMRAEKAAKYKELKGLKDKKHSAEYDEWFLRYRPADNSVSARAGDDLKQNKINHNNKTQKASASKKTRGKTRRKKSKHIFDIF